MTKLKLDHYILFCLVVLLIYTAVNLYLFQSTGQEPSTLTTCIFAAFGGEFLTCGLIKIFKIRDAQNFKDKDKEGEETNG